MGLRDAIRYVLTKYPDGLTGRDIAEKLEQLGWQAKGKTPAYARVTGEVSRMKKRGKLLKPGKRYRLSP